MSSMQTTQLPPEAAGPGSYDEQSGAVRYGTGTGTVRIGRIPPQDASRRHVTEPGQGHPANVVPADGVRCPRCVHVPDAVIVPLNDALAAEEAAR